MKIKAIYENPRALDRYTVIFDERRGEFWIGLALSADTGPQGVSCWVEVRLPNPELGREISFDDLPVSVQKEVRRRLQKAND
jgi:hypothetical protein